MHYYRFQLKDYVASARHLLFRPLEDVTFRRLIDEYHYTEKPLPDDLPTLSRKIGMEESFVELVLKEFFERSLDGEGKSCWRLKWADEGIEYYKQLSKRQSEKAAERWSRSASSN